MTNDFLCLPKYFIVIWVVEMKYTPVWLFRMNPRHPGRDAFGRKLRWTREAKKRARLARQGYSLAAMPPNVLEKIGELLLDAIQEEEYEGWDALNMMTASKAIMRGIGGEDRLHDARWIVREKVASIRRHKLEKEMDELEAREMKLYQEAEELEDRYVEAVNFYCHQNYTLKAPGWGYKAVARRFNICKGELKDRVEWENAERLQVECDESPDEDFDF